MFESVHYSLKAEWMVEHMKMEMLSTVFAAQNGIFKMAKKKSADSAVLYLALHGICIDLTHVGPFVTALHVSHHQLLTGNDMQQQHERNKKQL